MVGRDKELRGPCHQVACMEFEDPSVPNCQRGTGFSAAGGHFCGFWSSSGAFSDGGGGPDAF